MSKTVKLSFFRVLYLHWLSGHYRSSTFKNYLHKSIRATYYNISLDPFTAQFIARDDVRTFYREHMPYQWLANNKTGKLPLGICTQSEALRRLAQLQPKSVVLNVDAIFPFIFYKEGD